MKEDKGGRGKEKSDKKGRKFEEGRERWKYKYKAQSWVQTLLDPYLNRRTIFKVFLGKVVVGVLIILLIWKTRIPFFNFFTTTFDILQIFKANP